MYRLPYFPCTNCMYAFEMSTYTYEQLRTLNLLVQPAYCFDKIIILPDPILGTYHVLQANGEEEI